MRDSEDFSTTVRRGQKAGRTSLVVHVLPDAARSQQPMVGFVVSKAAGSAVERNRVKRRLREAWRERLVQVPAGRDYVLIARPALGESLARHDAAWLGERVDDVLGKAAA